MFVFMIPQYVCILSLIIFIKPIISIGEYNHQIDPEQESVTNVVGSGTLRLPRVSPSPNICQRFYPILNSGFLLFLVKVFL